jgi:N-methylhydantoinase A/oxoprolinase/acetone carboxylase beta subunit
VDPDLGRFVRRQRELSGDSRTLSAGQKEVWNLTGQNPVALQDLLAGVKIPALYRRNLDDLVGQGILAMSAFTPTDALHVLGRYRCWSVEAAELGAALWAARLGETPESFAERVVRQVEVQAGRAILDCVLGREGIETAGCRDGLGPMLIDRALGADRGGSFSLTLSLRRPVVAIGAPVAAYLPAVASRIGATLCVPGHAAVANAVGTVAGGVAQTVRILIRPEETDGAYRVHLPSGTRTFPDLEEAVACARQAAEAASLGLALRAGADRPRVKIERNDRIARGGAGRLEEIYMETEVTARAVGRPRIGRVNENP